MTFQDNRVAYVVRMKTSAFQIRKIMTIEMKQAYFLSFLNLDLRNSRLGDDPFWVLSLTEWN